ncbi:MAG: hypothetical protein HZB39_18650 [Planctomycetes bacterium]|nr:hypothetical protein [Planctomycetota bacterium]
MTKGAAPNGRSPSGQFAKGNAGGPGGTRQRSFVLRQAAEHAITPEHIEALMRKALRMGLEGDVRAIRLVLEWTCGRPAEVATNAEPLDFAMPPLQTAAQCNAALEFVAAALCEGRLNRDAAQVLIELIHARIKAIEVADLERRLLELEARFETVEPFGRRRR